MEKALLPTIKIGNLKTSQRSAELRMMLANKMKEGKTERVSALQKFFTGKRTTEDKFLNKLKRWDCAQIKLIEHPKYDFLIRRTCNRIKFIQSILCIQGEYYYATGREKQLIKIEPDKLRKFPKGEDITNIELWEETTFEELKNHLVASESEFNLFPFFVNKKGILYSWQLVYNRYKEQLLNCVAL